MSTKHVDVAIIGGGNAGFGVSAVVHEAGKSLAFIEQRDFGGTCPNRGCTPKKVLVAAAHNLHEIALASVHGIDVGTPKIDWGKLIDRERGMIDFIPDAMAGVAKKRGDVFFGEARFVGANTLEVGEDRIEAGNIVIATGSKPRALPFPGAEHLITSDEVLSERDLPGEVVFIGGGVIALEFTHVYARAGAKVTILEVLPRLLPRMDEDAVAQIHKVTEGLGVTISTGVKVEAVEKGRDGRLTVHFSQGGENHTVTADRVVNGAGRVANVDSLDLSAGNIDHDGVRVSVDDTLRSTSNPSVWVAGDALVTSAQLSPIATYEGRIVGQNIVDGPKHKPDYLGIPQAIYTVPALASIGLTEEEAKVRGLDVDVRVNDMVEWFSAKSYAEPAAWAKVLVDKASDRIVGAHMVGHHGEDLIHMFAMAMKFNITTAQIKDMVFGFPSFASDIKNIV
ncbi:MAG: dihydrolipoyl dehydrogenase family protein [Alphaproteobacteria bacterium]